VKLAFESSATPASVAFGTNEGIHSKSFEGGRGRELLAVTQELLARHGKNLQEVQSIVVGVGPGSYTGLRIACAAASTLGYALKIPVSGICSLEACALSAPFGEDVHFLLDAYRKEVYHACYRRHAHSIEVVTPPQVVACQDADQFVPEGAHLVGDPSFVSHRVDILSEHLTPTAEQLLQFVDLGHEHAPLQPIPLYLRNQGA